MEIYLVRHPRPTRCEGLCYGRSDVPVDPEELAGAAASVRSLIPARVLRNARMFTSPASRCLGLARELAAPGEPCVAEELHEMYFGAWEGVPWDSVPRAELETWAADVWSYRAGGGESAAMVAARWRGWSARLTSQSRDLPAIAVTHAGLIRVALAGARGLGAELMIDAPFASVHRVDIDASRPGTP
ncbi:MAG: histidine phosphatase family protein [Steroidobacteraceae bacterium]|jgi:alpha-ribazole phosphatase